MTEKRPRGRPREHDDKTLTNIVPVRLADQDMEEIDRRRGTMPRNPFIRFLIRLGLKKEPPNTS